MKIKIKMLRADQGAKLDCLFLQEKKPPKHFALSEKNSLVARQVGHLFKGNIFCCHHFYTSGFFLHCTVQEQKKNRKLL